MPKHCIVKGCKSNFEKGFPFPLDKIELVRRWVAALESHQDLPSDYESRVVCPAHFLEADYLKSKKNKLNSKAVPSVFPILPDGYVSEGEGNTEIKQEPTDYTSRPGGKNLRRKRLTIPVTEPDSEEDVGSDYEPSESEDEMSFTGGDMERIEQMDDRDDSPDNIHANFPTSTSDVDTSRGIDSTLNFLVVGNEEALDSDYEPVTETSILELQGKVNKKTEILNKEKSTLGSMEEMIKNQAATILKLEEELSELMKAEAEENKNFVSDKAKTHSNKLSSKATSNVISKSQSGSKVADYSNLDLQTFSISLYYFSPNVYSYLESIMPYLPPKKIVLDWIKSGYAFTLFPPGVLLKENFVLE